MFTWDDSHKWLRDAHDAHNAYEECKSIYDLLLPELADELNNYHSLKWSSIQYQKLLGNWLFNFIQMTHDRWFGSTPKMIGINDTSAYIATNSLEFIHTYQQSHLANHNLYKQVASYRYQSSFQQTELPSRLNCTVGFDLVGDTTAPVCISEPFHSFGRVGWRFLLPRRSFPKELHEYATLVDFRLKPSVSVNVDKTWRLARLGVASNVDIVDTFSSLIRLHLPLIFLEGFPPLLKSAQSIRVSSLFTAVSMQYNIPFKCVAANLDDSCPIFIHQHGANYGTDLFCGSEYYERSVSNRFFTWGWKEDETTDPLPAPSRLLSWRISPSRRILLTCANRSPYLTRYYCHENGVQNLETIEDTIELVKKLAHLDIEISYYRHDFGWDVRERFGKAGARIPEKSTRSEYYGLHVVNYFGTAWLETMATNIPTICFFDPDKYLFRDTCKPYIDRLFEVGILHGSADSAVDKILKVQEDPLRWWLGDEVQEIREAFVERYARLEDTWLDTWVEEFPRMAEMVRDGGYLD
jgi:putative transferase (TIGR04331 family)